jgi:hypothetical protein
LPFEGYGSSRCLTSIEPRYAFNNFDQTFHAEELKAIQQILNARWLQGASQQTVLDQFARISSLEADVDELKAKVALVTDSERRGDA